MSLYLSTKPLTAEAPGKVILLGEHSVLFGHRALAVALQDVLLRVELLPPSDSLSSWSAAWQFLDARGAQQTVSSEMRQALTTCLELVPKALGWSGSLNDFVPQPIRVRSDIPLGAGMGGSAALSVALLRLFTQIRPGRFASFSDEVAAANELDSVFHGSASGVDVSTVLQGGVVQFRRGTGVEPVWVAREFWLVVVDSGSRSRTIDMVEKVKSRRLGEARDTDLLLNGLGDLAVRALSALSEGNLPLVGQSLSEAHQLLSRLGLSTQGLDDVVAILHAHGALGAKLTGAGGGGMAIGLFAERPSEGVLHALRPRDLFVTRIVRSL